MDISSSIAAASIYMHQSQFQQSVGIALAEKVLDIQEIDASKLIESLQEPIPSFGHILDIKV